MLNQSEAKEVDEIIQILRIWRTAEFFYAYSDFIEQLSAKGKSPTGKDIIPNLEMLCILDRQLGHALMKSISHVGLFRHLKKHGLIDIEKSSYNSPLFLTGRSKKFVAFVRVAHETEWQRYFLQFHRRFKKLTTFFYTTRILLFIKRFTHESGFPPQSISSIERALKWSHGSIYQNLDLLESEEFIKFAEATQPYFGTRMRHKGELFSKKPKAVQLTPRGEQLLEEMEKAYRAYQKA